MQEQPNKYVDYISIFKFVVKVIFFWEISQSNSLSGISVNNKGLVKMSNLSCLSLQGAASLIQMAESL